MFVRSFVFIFLVHSFSHTKIYVEFDKDKMARLFRSFHIDESHGRLRIFSSVVLVVGFPAHFK